MKTTTFVLGAALACAPGLALAQAQNQNQMQPSHNQAIQNQPTQNQPTQMNDERMNQNTQMRHDTADQNTQTQNEQMQGSQAQKSASMRLLPSDAKLVGVSEATEIRTFPEQSGAKGENAGNIQKEDVAGVGAVDRVWQTKRSYTQTVKHFDQAIKSEKAEPLAVTTTQTAKAWNLRMPDGHITNVVVRNTNPTTIEAVEVAGAEGSVKLNDTQKTNK